MRHGLAIFGFAVTLGLGACSPGENQTGSVTADEARQLNDAASMLDANSVDATMIFNSQETPPP